MAAASEPPSIVRRSDTLRRLAELEWGVIVLPLGVVLLAYGLWVLGPEGLKEAVAPTLFGIMTIIRGLPGFVESASTILA